MSVHPLISSAADPVRQAKVHLAAALRLAVLHELEEGIDNHFTVTVPGHDDRYLILPFGLHWSEARASDMIVFDESGRTLEGDGVVELSAQCIHAPIHRISGARVVHAHPSDLGGRAQHAEGQPARAREPDRGVLPRPRRLRRQLHGHRGLLEEGERLARVMGDKHVLFMKNHGVLVTGDTVAQAYRRLYKLERVCRAQVLAMSTGKPLEVLSDEIVAQVQAPAVNDRHSRAERERLFFEAMMRVLDRELPGYAD